MLQVNLLRKNYGKQVVLDDISFKVFAKEKIGLVGSNGAGKSTLFKIITNEISADKGEVVFAKNISVGLLKQNLSSQDKKKSLLVYTTSINNEIAVIQDRLEEIDSILAERNDSSLLDEMGHLQEKLDRMNFYDLEYKAESFLSGLGFKEKDFHRPLNEFSSGWQMRSELARVLISDNDLLLLDEPSNYLDLPAITWLEKYLNSFQGSLMLISHDRFLLNKLTEITLELFQGKVYRYKGNYDYFITQREERNNQLISAYNNQQKKREQLEQFITKFKAKASKATQAKSKMKQLEKMEVINAPLDEIKGVKIKLSKPPRCSPTILNLNNIYKTYDNKNYIYNNLSLAIENGDKVGIIGSNGVGKSTLLKIIVGVLKIEQGERILGNNVKIAYHSQDDLDNLNSVKTVWQIARSENEELDDRYVRGILATFGFKQDDILKTVEVLSGGEKSRLSLAKQLLNKANFLVLDEPTTHLDIPSIESLQQALEEYEGTLCLVSHDIVFLRSIATCILYVTEDKATLFHGNYDYYLSKIRNEDVKEVKENIKPSIKVVKKNVDNKQQKYFEKKLKEIEEKLDCLQQEYQSLIALYDKEDIDIVDLNKQVKEKQEKISVLELEWEEISDNL